MKKSNSKESKTNLECGKVKCRANRSKKIGKSWLNMQAVPLAGSIFLASWDPMDRGGVNDAGFRPCIYINICEHDCTLWLLTVNIWKLYVHCSWRSDLRSYEHYWTNSWSKAWKIFQARSGFEPMTFAIPLQRSTNWANMPNGSWSMFWVQINIPSGD